MYLDRNVISGGITALLLSKLIERHIPTVERFNHLGDYYNGKHKILNRQRASAQSANNKVVCNHAKYIVKVSSAYLAGNPVTYSVSDGYDIETIKDEYNLQDMASIDSEIVKQASIYGKAYELVYQDENSKPRSAVINPQSAFVVYSADCKREPLFGVYYYITRDIDGNEIGCVCNVYDDTNTYIYTSQSTNWASMELIETKRHFFGYVPLIEYKNNDEEQGDFEQVIPLIDAYNVLMSDRVNDKEEFVEAFLFLKGIDVDSETSKKLKEEKILMGYEDSDARYLSKIMTESDMQILRNDLKEDIHRLSMVPDLSDKEFGNNLSGVAIRYKLMAFEQHTKDKERYIAKGLRRRFEMYNCYLAIQGRAEYVPSHRVDIVFTHNLPANNLETSQMISNLIGAVTNETLIGQLDFVSDPKEETELLQAEKEEQLKRTQSALDLRDYTKMVKTNE